MSVLLFCFVFFFNDTATTEIYTLSLHDALPISQDVFEIADQRGDREDFQMDFHFAGFDFGDVRSEEHTSELQSHHDLVCRLLLEKKKKKKKTRDENSINVTRAADEEGIVPLGVV